MAGTELSLLLKLGSFPKFSEFSQPPVIHMIIRPTNNIYKDLGLSSFFSQDDDNDSDDDDDDDDGKE